MANSLLSLPTSKGNLEEGNDAGDEYHSGDDLTAGGVVVQHAQGGGEDEGDAHDSTDHRQVVLKDEGVLILRLFIINQCSCIQQ